MTEEYVNFIPQHSVPKAMTLEKIAEATSEDYYLKSLRAGDTIESIHAIKKPFNSC